MVLTVDEDFERLPALSSQLFLIDIVHPYAFDDLEDLVSDIELIVELRVCSRGFTLDVKFHESVKEVVVGKLHGNELITEDTLLQVHEGPSAGEE